MTPPPSLHHIVRIRTLDDLNLYPALMDEVMVNGNLLEHSLTAPPAPFGRTTLPSASTRSSRAFRCLRGGGTKGRDEAELHAPPGRVVQGTSVQIAAGPLLETVPSDDEWRVIASNVISYQRERWFRSTRNSISSVTNFGRSGSSRQHSLPSPPAKTASTAFSPRRAPSRRQHVGLPVIVPPDRLGDPAELERLLRSIRLTASARTSCGHRTSRRTARGRPGPPSRVVRLVSSLASRGVPVGHLHGGYVALACMTSVSLRSCITSGGSTG